MPASCLSQQAGMRARQGADALPATLPGGNKQYPLNMLGMFRCIYPVAKGCKRYQMTKEQLLVLQNKQENKLLITKNNR